MNRGELNKKYSGIIREKKQICVQEISEDEDMRRMIFKLISLPETKEPRYSYDFYQQRIKDIKKDRYLKSICIGGFNPNSLYKSPNLPRSVLPEFVEVLFLYFTERKGQIITRSEILNLLGKSEDDFSFFDLIGRVNYKIKKQGLEGIIRSMGSGKRFQGNYVYCEEKDYSGIKAQFIRVNGLI